MRTITLEEHYATPVFMDGPGRQIKEQAEAVRAHPEVAAGLDRLIDQLCDIGEGRIANMDAAGIDVQVLSLTAPGVEQLEAVEAVALARVTNDTLAEAVHRHPDRLAGFAALPTAEPDAAADELRRTVAMHGFKGALINGHRRGRYLDDTFFWPILECVEALQVPLYLHPPPPPQAVVKNMYAGNYPAEVAGALATAAWGWHIDTAIHLIRLILSGAFDHYPDLQLVIGHLGETLPFMLPRLERALPTELTHLDRPVSAYLRENVHYTFSGFNWTPAFLDLLLQVGADRIMFSTDYPYASMTEARTFLDRLPVSPAEKERIAHGNAERLLQLNQRAPARGVGRLSQDRALRSITDPRFTRKMPESCMSQRRYAALSHTRSSDLRALQLVSDVRPGMVPGDRSSCGISWRARPPFPRSRIRSKSGPRPPLGSQPFRGGSSRAASVGRRAPAT